MELIRVQIILLESERMNDSNSHPTLCSVVPDFCSLKKMGCQEESLTGSSLLLQCAKSCDGLSGRTLRKLPFRSHAFFIRSKESISITKFISALQDGIKREKNARKELNV